ncbi:hypothetical protein I7I53_00721 [Histoplasma capsulatum var. duboisii H88]|uniref:Uncharacterized protein n=1 Tax=Ajellomyces capsulatus (strain H88) TaxID=544711 RepID=A0A8A1LLD4_AJEC8|nr:hypothetical protein I7I53_00721 [Histoplasma capsulatum var. duboisii H88]
MSPGWVSEWPPFVCLLQPGLGSFHMSPSLPISLFASSAQRLSASFRAMDTHTHTHTHTHTQVRGEQEGN